MARRISDYVNDSAFIAMERRAASFRRCVGGASSLGCALLDLGLKIRIFSSAYSANSMKSVCEILVDTRVSWRVRALVASLGVVGNVCLASQAASIEHSRPIGEVVKPADSSSAVAFDFQLGWESRYVSEGRDNLDGDGLWTGTFELGYHGFTAGVWYANGPEADYEQFDAWIQYTHEIGDLEISLAYAYLNYLSDETHDSELGLGLEYGALPWDLSVFALGYYSFDADGAFFEVGLSGEYEIQPWLTVTPYLIFGMNSDYIADGHNGANNVALGVEAEIPVTPCLSLRGHAAYNLAIDSDAGRYAGDTSLDDFFHGGLSLNYLF